LFSSVGRFFRIAAFTLFCLAFIAFAVDNREAVEVSFFPFPYHIELPLFIITLFFFFFGSILGYMVSVISKYHLKHRLKKAEDKNAALENQLASVRAESQISGSLTTNTPSSDI
jgi:uncharacterized integral membrane protein